MNRFLYTSGNNFHTYCCKLCQLKPFGKLQRGYKIKEIQLLRARSISCMSTNRTETNRIFIISSLVNIPFRSSSSSRHHKKPSVHSPTYLYDVLHISPHATQAQIKNAYFRLSKLYHPDINKSPEATAIFHEISESYEILGNTRKRRLYDRGIIPSELGTDHGSHGDMDQHTSKDGFKRMHFEPRHRHSPTGRSHIYNFDEFYRMHYGTCRREEAKESIKRQKRVLEREQQELHRNENVPLIPAFILFLCAVGYSMYQFSLFENKQQERSRKARENNDKK